VNLYVYAERPSYPEGTSHMSRVYPTTAALM
jgi:hypothetical protein